MRRCATLALAVLAVSLAPASASAYPSHHVKRLERQVKALKHSRATWRHRARVAEHALRSGLAAQVSEVAKAGRASQLQTLIFGPIRAAWPCGADGYQGEYSWSISVDLADTIFNPDGPDTVLDCH